MKTSNMDEYEWMNEMWMNKCEWMNKYMNEWMNEMWMNEWINICIHIRMNE